MAENQGHRYGRLHQFATFLSVSFTDLGLKSLEPDEHPKFKTQLPEITEDIILAYGSRLLDILFAALKRRRFVRRGLA